MLVVFVEFLLNTFGIPFGTADFCFDFSHTSQAKMPVVSLYVVAQSGFYCV